MEPTAITVVSQLITDARSRFGAAEVEALYVDAAVLDEAMAHVLTLGGEVTSEGCVVDGVMIRELPDSTATPHVRLSGADEPRPMPPHESE